MKTEKPPFEEHEHVKLIHSIENEDTTWCRSNDYKQPPQIGDTGAIVHIYGNHVAYEVEFDECLCFVHKDWITECINCNCYEEKMAKVEKKLEKYK